MAYLAGGPSPVSCLDFVLSPLEKVVQVAMLMHGMQGLPGAR
jgi:hypothetical protein